MKKNVIQRSLYSLVLWVMGRVALYRLTTLYRLARWQRLAEHQRTLAALSSLGDPTLSALATTLWLRTNEQERGKHE